MSQFNFGNVEASGVIEGLGQGLDQAAKNLYTIQQNRIKVDQEQQKLDNETDYKHSQIDYLEGRGQLAGAQADSYRFLIDQAKKAGQRKVDVGNDHLDTAHMQQQQKLGQYRTLLNQALQSPEGQDYIAQNTSGASDATGMESDTTQGPDMGSSTVNNIMPGVGNQAPTPQVQTGNAGVSSQLRKEAYGSAAPKRNASLQKALGHINSMQIDNREDAQYALNKYYGADWESNPDAVNFLNTKFGTPGGSGAASSAVGGPTTGKAAADVNAGGAPSDLISVTGPDGTPYKMPRANLQKALSRGYRVRQ